MFIKLMSFFPEAVLIFLLPLMYFVKTFRTSATPKTYFTLSKYFILINVIISFLLIKHENFNFYQVNMYTCVFKILMYIASGIWFFLSYRWFLHEERSSYKFFSLCIGALFCLSVVISCRNLWILIGALLLQVIFNYFLILLREEEEKIKIIAKRYLLFSLFFVSVMIGGATIFYHYSTNLDYDKIKILLSLHNDKELFLASGMILAGVLYFMGVAPFHFWFLDVVKYSILPVSGFLTFVPIWAYFSCLCALLAIAFPSLSHQFEVIIWSFALMSLYFGAIEANGAKNVLRLFACGSVFNMGMILISLNAVNEQTLINTMFYLLVYVLSMLGCYSVLFGFKSRGIYVYELREIAGISRSKVYLSAALLLFLLYLSGMPPLLGFAGRLSVLNSLFAHGHYYLVAASVFALILIINAYLNLIKTIYFDNPIMSFDRSDKSILVCVSFNFVLGIIILLHPTLIQNIFERVMQTLF